MVPTKKVRYDEMLMLEASQWQCQSQRRQIWAPWALRVVKIINGIITPPSLQEQTDFSCGRQGVKAH